MDYHNTVQTLQQRAVRVNSMGRLC